MVRTMVAGRVFVTLVLLVVGSESAYSEQSNTLTKGATKLSNVSAPAWVLEIPEGTWAPISLNTLADVDPAKDPEANPNYPKSAPWTGNTGQASVTDAWNGGALAEGYGTHGGLILFGGGHANYFGSEVYAFDLATRQWRRLTNPYPGPFNWPYANSEYPDGSAIPPHTYSFSAYDPSTNSYVLAKGQNELGNVTGFDSQEDIVHLFSLDTFEWRRSKYAPEPRPQLYSGGWAVYDSRRGLIWAEGGSGGDFMVAFDPHGDNGDGTYGRWIDVYPRKTTYTNTVAEYDPVDDIIVILPWREDPRIAGIDLSNPDADEVYLEVKGDGPNIAQSTGFSWSEANAAFLQYGSTGPNVYSLKLISGDWDTGTWQWTLLTTSNNKVSPEPTATGNGIFDRFQVVSYADAEIAVAVNGVNYPVYAFRVPQSVRPNPPSDITATPD